MLCFLPLFVLALYAIAGAGQVTAVGLAASAAVALFLARLLRERDEHPPGPMEGVVLDWGNGPPLTLTDLLRGIIVWGAPGSGKTSGSADAIARAVLAIPRSGMLILGSKPEELGEWVERVKAANREADFVVFEAASGKERFNFIEFENRHGDSRSLSQFLSTVSETISGESAKGGENEKFWKEGTDRLTYMICEAVRQGMGEVTAPYLHEFLATALCPQKDGDGEAAEERYRKSLAEWATGFHVRCMEAAAARKKTEIEGYDYEIVRRYFGREFQEMDFKVRSSLVAAVNNCLFIMNTGIVRRSISTTTTVSPVDIENGKLVFVNCPVHELGASGRFIMAGWKFEFQKHFLRRHYKPGQPPCVCFADEAHNVVSSFDSYFANESRSHGTTTVYLTQSIHALFDKLGEHKAEALLGAFYTKIFHLLNDSKSAEYGSGLLGQKLEVGISGSSGEGSTGDELFGKSQVKSNFSLDYKPVLQTSAFLSGLRTGGAANGNLVDGILIQGGKHRFVTFRQR